MRAVLVWGAIGLALSMAWIIAAHLLGVDSFDRGWLAGAITIACNAWGLSVATRCEAAPDTSERSMHPREAS